MAYDQALAERVRRRLTRRQRVVERRMFGGLAFLVRGHMCCGIQGSRLMARVGPERYHAVLRWPGARPMDFTGKALTGFVYVSAAGVRTGAQLRRWIDACLAFTRTLPPKSRKSVRRRT